MPGVSNKLLLMVAENPCICFIYIDEPVFFIGYGDPLGTAGKGFKEPILFSLFSFALGYVACCGKNYFIPLEFQQVCVQKCIVNCSVLAFQSYLPICLLYTSDAADDREV